MMNGALLKSANLAGRNILAMQKRMIVSTPPQVRMSFTTKMLLGGGMCLGCLTPPAYIIFNLQYYNKSKTRE